MRPWFRGPNPCLIWSEKLDRRPQTLQERLHPRTHGRGADRRVCSPCLGLPSSRALPLTASGHYICNSGTISSNHKGRMNEITTKDG